jgi:hypothetical protein
MFLLHVSITQGHLQATHFCKESTALHMLSIVPLSPSFLLIFYVIGCPFLLSFALRLLSAMYNMFISVILT